MASTAELVTDSVADLTKKAEPPKTFWSMSMKERFAYVKEVITVEPLVAAYVLATNICSPSLLQLEFEKACRSNLGYNDTVCDDIIFQEVSNFSNETGEIQTLVSNVHSWQVPLQSVMPLILILFLGSYSDRHKLRKPFLLLPVFGEFFAVIGCIVSVIFMKEWSLEVHGFLQTVVPSLFGGPAMLIMAVFAYIADVSTVEMRTLRIGMAQIVFTACLPIAQSVSGILYEKIGYIGVLVLGGVFFLFGFLYGIFWIKEPRQPDLKSNQSFIRDVFDLRHAIDTFMLLLKKSPGNNRAFVWAVIVITFIFSVVNAGEGSVFYTYIAGNFKWTLVEFSYFITSNTLVHLVGTFVGVPLFANILHMPDVIILGLTFIDKIIANIIFGLAKTSTMLYVAMVVSVITGITPIAIKSITTKIVSPDDLGKAQSLFAITEALGPVVAAPVYNTGIYVTTKDTFPTAYFYFGALLYALTMILIVLMFLYSKKYEAAEAKPDPNSFNMNINTNGKSAEEYQTTHI